MISEVLAPFGEGFRSGLSGVLDALRVPPNREVTGTQRQRRLQCSGGLARADARVHQVDEPDRGDDATNRDQQGRSLQDRPHRINSTYEDTAVRPGED